MNTFPANAARLAGPERESFFAAQARYRRDARRWGVAMTVVVTIITAAISLLLAPVTYALIGLLLDLVNLAVPMPDLIGAAWHMLDALTNGDRAVPAARIVETGVLAALPGFGVLMLVWLRLGRVVSRGNHEAMHAVLGLRDPCPFDPEERQLGNVVDEMAIAAGRSPPRPQLLESDACNLALLGEDGDAVLVVAVGVLKHLDRAQTQALVAQAIAALGNGDGRLALRMLHLDLMIGLLTLLAQAPVDRTARTRLRPILRLRTGSGGLDALRGALGASQGGKPDSESGAGGAVDASSGSGGGWRTWAWMPLMGSLLVGILIVPISAGLLVAPLNGIIWRRRRLLADATAVQFTRDPEALAEAYSTLARHRTALDLRMRGLGDLFLLDTGAESNLRLGSPYPKLRTRVARLNAMGASVALGERKRAPLWIWLIGVPVGVVVAVLCCTIVVLGVWLSLALNGLFLAIPIAVLHALLRGLAT